MVKPLDAKRRAEMAAEEKALAKCRKDSLVEMVKQNYRVVDLRGADKWLLVGMMMEAKFGRKDVEQFYAKQER